jgi:hypothetical protein
MIGVSKRKIATTLNVSRQTINRDLGTNVPPAPENVSQNKGRKGAPGTNVPPALLEGERAR